METLRNLREDVRFYRQLHFPGQQPSFFSNVIAVLGSRGLMVLAAHRITNRYKRLKPQGALRWLYKLAVHIGNYLSKVLGKCHILAGAGFEPGVYLSDGGHIILGARSVGSGTLIHDRVTIGINLQNKGIPEIGRNVWIGPNCLISGGISIGDGVTILPGTVLTKSLPPGVVVQGNPARIVKRDYDNSRLRQSAASDAGLALE
jgi:serine O-acetyltransferase